MYFDSNLLLSTNERKNTVWIFIGKRSKFKIVKGYTCITLYMYLHSHSVCLAMKHTKTMANIFRWKTLVTWWKNWHWFFSTFYVFLSHSHKLIYALQIYTWPVSIHFPMKTKKCTSILKMNTIQINLFSGISIKVATNDNIENTITLGVYWSNLAQNVVHDEWMNSIVFKVMDPRLRSLTNLGCARMLRFMLSGLNWEFYWLYQWWYFWVLRLLSSTFW